LGRPDISNELKVAAVCLPRLNMVYQVFSLWTLTQMLNFGTVEFTRKPKVDEGWTILQTQGPRLGERKINKFIYLVRPPRGGWLHRGPLLRVACRPTRPLESSTPCRDDSFVVLP
jgi:hypothetical protein